MPFSSHMPRLPPFIIFEQHQALSATHNADKFMPQRPACGCAAGECTYEVAASHVPFCAQPSKSNVPAMSVLA